LLIAPPEWVLPFRNRTAQYRVKYGCIEKMPKEMCSERPRCTYIEIHDAECQRDDEKARPNHHRLPRFMPVQNPAEDGQRSKCWEISGRAV
jgi:hypothetical protein